MNKKILFLVVVALSTAITVGLVISDTFLLKPVGRIRVSLEDNSLAGGGHGRATWNPFIQVFDGSFSAELNTGTDSSSDFAAVIVSPLNLRLINLDVDDIKFWAYHWNNKDLHPMVDLVLDNGRMLEGVSSVNVSGASPDCAIGAGCLGYEAAEIWIQMKPTDEFYSSFAATDPVIPDEFANPKPLNDWQAAFPSARVVQLRITYGFSSTDSQVFIDNLRLDGKLVRIEPESVGLPPHVVP